MIRKHKSDFAGDRSGSVAIMFALSTIPVLGLAGAAVDYSRATTARTQMQAAADGAALAAVNAPNLTDQQRVDLAKRMFAANVAGSVIGAPSVSVKVEKDKVTVKVDAPINNEFMSLVGIPSSTLGVTSQAVNGATATLGNVEISLVLDTTGSMANDMGSLRAAARDFVNTVMTGSNVKVSVVPYVAAVNVGRANLANWMIEKDGKSKWHGVFFREGWAGSLQNCNVNQGGGGGGGGGPNIGNGVIEGGNIDHLDIFKSLNKVALELFGVKAANAEMMNTIQPISGTQYTATRSNNPSATGFLPRGMLVPTNWHPCRFLNPSYVSHWDLFNRIPNAQWKGCVEARPEPYDVTDDPPSSSQVDSLYVQYFYPDESSGWNNRNGKNNYLPDGPFPSNFNGWVPDPNPMSLFKYNGVTRATINEAAPDVMGPNRACPDELLPLTTDKTRVLSKIDNLKHYNGGGTISSEGIAWGWRTLSPNEPFKSSPYGTSTRKVIVLMTDGKNEISLNPGKYADWDDIISEYTAYGFLNDVYDSLVVPNWKMKGRFPRKNFQEATKFFDGRMTAVCENAKRKGVEIYTILFRVSDTSARNLVRACATSERQFFTSDNATSLSKAFKDAATTIAGGASGTRLSK
jgi:Flp pilus assembly protein TadG